MWPFSALAKIGASAMAAVNPPERPRWPSAPDRERLRRYYRNEDLLEGNHEQVFVGGREFKFEYDTSRDYVTVNLCGRLTRLLTQRAFGEPTVITVPNEQPGTQSFVEWLGQQNRLDWLWKNLHVDASSAGDAVARVRYDEPTGRIVVERVVPTTYYAEFDPLDATRRTAAIIAQIMEDDAGKQYLWQERHELRDGTGWVVNVLYRLHGDLLRGEMRFDPEKDRVPLATILCLAALPDEMATGVDDLLLVHIPNGDGCDAWGTSDYADVVSLQGEVNNRWTQRAEVLDKFVDPFMWGPPLGNESAYYHMREFKYIDVPSGTSAAPVGMVTWDAQLAVVETTIHDSTAAFAAVVGVDFAALLPQENKGPVSGRALRIAQMQTQSTAQHKQAQFLPAIQQIVSLATKLASAPGVTIAWAPTDGTLQVVEMHEVDVRFGDGLPEDRIEDVEEQVTMVDAGLQAKLDAIKILHGLDDEEAQALLDQIKAEKDAALSTMGLPQLSLGRGFRPVQPAGKPGLQQPGIAAQDQAPAVQGA